MANNGHRIESVSKNSIAQEMGIEAGDYLLEICGKVPVDIFDYKYLINDEYIEVSVRKADGEEWFLEIEKEASEDLGIDFANGLMDDYHHCCNNCIFCFIDQMPPGMRDTLYFKDDDSRLSFLQGNYITLTNMKDEDIKRLVYYHLSPIQVSIHTTNQDLRCKMLRNKNAGNIMERLRTLTDAGVVINGQIVLCRGINDGLMLDDTIRDLSGLIPEMQSLSVVPVGLTKYREGLYELQLFDRDEALKVVKQIEAWQDKIYKSYGIRFVYASDEWYIMAGLDLPGADYYEGYPQLENGVGMLRLLRSQVDERLKSIRADRANLENTLKKRHITIATGYLAAPFIVKLCDDISKVTGCAEVNVVPIHNDFFGESITVSGLITGGDLIGQLSGMSLGDELLIPENMLRYAKDVFLDDVKLSDVSEKLAIPVRVVKNNGDDFVAAVSGFGEIKEISDGTAEVN